MNIQDIFIRERAALAPLAGITDSVYRRICAEFGARPVMTEMVSSDGYIRGHGSDKTMRLLRFRDAERPIGFQFFGSNPDILAAAARRSLEFGPDFVDLNAGCPMKKVVGRGAGSALLLDHDNLARIVEAVVAAVSPLPVSVKIRSGWDHESINAVETARVIAGSGAQAIIVHPRTRSQLFSGHSDWEIIRAVREAVSLPVIGCGDIRSAEDASRMLAETGAHSVMIGRGAMGRPWIFRQVAEHLAGRPIPPAPGLDERFDLAIRHMETLAAEVSEKFSVLNMRKFFAWYSKGMIGGSEFRQRVFAGVTMDAVRRVVDEFRGAELECGDHELSLPDIGEME